MPSQAPPTSPPLGPSSHPPGPRPPRPPGRLARGLAKGIAALISLATVAVLFQSLWGASDRYSWLFLAAGAALGLLSAACGWLVALRSNRSAGAGAAGAGPGLLAWLAFPVSFFGFLGMITLLLLAAVPEMRVRLDPGDLIVAARRGDRLEITFPQPTAGNAVNLRLDDRPIPAEFIRRRPELFQWMDLRIKGDNRRLVLDLAAILRELDLPPPAAVRINENIDAEPIKDPLRRRILPQMVPVPPP